MIVVIAPYSPPGRINQRIAHFGAARKIEAVVSALKIVNNNVILVNSSPVLGISKIEINEYSKIGRSSVIEISVPEFLGKKLAKVISMLMVRQIFSEIEKYGAPELVWCYNMYAFEMISAKYAKNRYKCKIVLELEDGIFARNRGVNIKPIIDFLAARWAESSIDWSVCVNSFLAKKMSDKGIASICLPGMVQNNNIDFLYREPFVSGENRIGYFGGLSVEKGADILLSYLVAYPEAKVKFIVTGGGELVEDFNKAMKLDCRLDYRGVVDADELMSAINDVDIIINPHSNLDGESQIFPSKVIEAVASGRIVISTALPDPGVVGILNGVCIYDGTVFDLNNAILGAKNFYVDNREKVCVSASMVKRYLSPTRLACDVRMLLENSLQLTRQL